MIDHSKGLNSLFLLIQHWSGQMYVWEIFLPTKRAVVLYIFKYRRDFCINFIFITKISPPKIKENKKVELSEKLFLYSRNILKFWLGHELCFEKECPTTLFLRPWFEQIQLKAFFRQTNQRSDELFFID